MRRDGEDRDLAGVRAVAPEDAIGPRRAILGIGLEYLGLGVERAWNGVIRVRLEPRVPGIGGKEEDGFTDLLEKPLLPR